MIRLLATLATVMAVSQTPILPRADPVSGKDRETTGPPCPPRHEPESAAPSPLDLARGLVFDPLAPGGARPENAEKITPVPVDPGMVRLFPVLPTPTEPKTEESEEDHDSIDSACDA